MLRTEEVRVRGAPAAAAPRCTLLLFRHLQKTGGVSLRHVMHRLELSRDWLNYAEERSNLTLTRTRTLSLSPSPSLRLRLLPLAGCVYCQKECVGRNAGCHA